jgi:hypothetical protein
MEDTFLRNSWGFFGMAKQQVVKSGRSRVQLDVRRIMSTRNAHIGESCLNDVDV